MTSTHSPTSRNERAQFAERLATVHQEILEITDNLIDAGERFVSTISIHKDDGLSIVKACLVLRLLSGLGALRLLAINGYYTEALGQKRSLMEALARLAALSKDRSLFDEYLMQDELNRAKIIADIIEFRRDWGPEIPRDPPDEELARTLAEIQAHIDDYNRASARRLRDIKTFDWAAKGQIAHLLLGDYVISSQSLHHAPRDLERRLVIVDEDLVGVSIGPETGNIDHLLLSACKLVFVGLQWFAESIEQEVPADIEHLYAHCEEVYGRYADAAIGDP
jgi:hypothetical protein